MTEYSVKLEKYCNDIKTGKIVAGTWTKKAISRFLSDLKKSKKDDFPYIYIQDEADKLLSFTESLKPGDLNGDTIHLLPWQIFILSNLEGWRHKEDLTRKRFRMAYNEVNRKNGKTTGLLFPLIIYNFIKYRASESYIVSSSDLLSDKTFKEVVDIIKAEPELDNILDCRSLAITFKDIEEKSRLGFYCDGGKSVDGLRPRFACLDEYHDYLSDKMFTSMLYGMRSKKDAQLVIVTTADTDTTRACYEQNLKAKRILNGTQTQDDFFAIIFALDEEDDFHNPDVWQKANPSLYDIIDPSVIQSDIDDAELSPHKIPELKAKTFGIWGGGSVKSWIPIETWQKNKDEEVNFDDFENMECFGGLDLAKVDDLCAFTLCFTQNNKKYFKHRFYIPEATLYERYKKENINFIQWVEKGIITAIPGATIDFDFITHDILEDAKKYHITAIGYDKWQSKNIINELEDKRPDVMLIEVDQSMRKMSPLTKSYEKEIRDGNIVDNNPSMIWQIGNCEAYYDPNDNIKIKKRSKASNCHIDGVISSIMAYGVSTLPEFNEHIEPIGYDLLSAIL